MVSEERRVGVLFYQPHGLNIEKFRVSRGREKHRTVSTVLDITY